MAPAFYHRFPVSMDKLYKEEVPRARLWLLGGLIGLTLVLIPLIILAVRASSEACPNGLQAHRECLNTTHQLQSQLNRAQDDLLQTENQAHTCNQTVVTLKAALEEKTSQGLEQQAHLEELKREITTLNEKLKTLQNTLEEQEALRKSKDSFSTWLQNSVGSPAASRLPAPLVLLVLVLLF